MRCHIGYWSFFVFAQLCTVASATTVDTNPLEKVNELLGVLGEQIKKEGEEDKETYDAYTKHYEKESTRGKAIIKESSDKVDQLQSDIKEAEAFCDGKRLEFTDLTGKLQKNNNELAAGKKARKKERNTFEENEVMYIEAVRQLELSLETMNKKMPSSASASSASLLDVADRLHKTLTQDSDISLSTHERDTLDKFVRTARSLKWPGPSFLQQGSHGPFGEFTSQSGGLISTLQSLLDKVKKERETSMQKEQKAKSDFTEFKTGLTTMIDNDEKSLSETKVAIAQSEEQTSKNKVSLLMNAQILEEESKEEKEREIVFRNRTQEYRIRLGKRADEAIAVHEAYRMLSGEVVKSYMDKQTIGTFKQRKAGLAQLRRLALGKASDRRKAAHILKHATSPALALVVLNSTTHFVGGGDAFADVKSMVKGLLKKLNAEQAKEATQESFCQEEIAKTAKSKQKKERDIDKMRARLDSLSAELTETKADISTASKDLEQVKEAMTEALRIRRKESRMMATAIQEYKNASALLKKGSNVLRAYYMNREGGGSEVKKDEFKQRHGLGVGIISILELAIDDFDKLYVEAKKAAKEATAEFNRMQRESVVRKAVFEKDLELNSQKVAALERDQHLMEQDIKSDKKELQTLGSYWEKLQASCVIKGLSYTERKAKRDAELDSLNEVLSYLTKED